MENKSRVEYDQIALTYNQRFAASKMEGVAAVLKKLVQELNARDILEVGCGTGYWLKLLDPGGDWISGLDLSLGMLRQTKTQNFHPALVCADVRHDLPFQSGVFDLVFCINAPHHFGGLEPFIAEAHRLLKKNACLAIVGANVRGQRDKWIVYRYFDGVYEMDLKRFSAWEVIADHLSAQGFKNVNWQEVERDEYTCIGEEIWQDVFLKKANTSQLTLLSDQEYADGIRRIKNAIKDAQVRGEKLVFNDEIRFTLLTGRA
jgi:SAM-dependent methyltransferase